MMERNLAKISQDEMDKVNVDLAAAGVAFKERYNMPVVADLVEREQPAHLRDWFRERLIAHRLASVSFRDYRGAETEIMRARLLPVGWQARPIPLRLLFCSGASHAARH
jgi:DNA polymerase-3 subunit theta